MTINPEAWKRSAVAAELRRLIDAGAITQAERATILASADVLEITEIRETPKEVVFMVSGKKSNAHE